MKQLVFWSRWAARDLRSRWVQVAVLGLVIAIGSGLYAGLSGTTTWREASLDASYEALHAHDVQITLADGSFVPEGELEQVASGVQGVAAVRERLSLPTQVEVEREQDPVLTSGRLVGVGALDAPLEGQVDALEATAGRTLEAGDEGQAVAVVQQGFARRNDLPVGATVELGGGVALESVGHVMSPEWFVVISDQQVSYAERTYGVVFTSLATAQEATGRPGQVNDLVVQVIDGQDPTDVGTAVVADLEERFPDVGFTSTPLDDDPGHRLLYDDVHTDGEFFSLFAGVVLVGAAFGALNLSRRSVERQRREIGVGLALGAPPRLLAVRPLLGGLQVAVVGVVAGVGVGLLVSDLMLGFVRELVELPEWQVSIDVGVYARAAAITVALVMAGTAWPVVRAVRVAPVEALRPQHLARAGDRGRRGASVLRRLLPRKTLARLPFGNVARARQRLVLTVLALGASTALLVVTSALLTSFTATLDRAEGVLGSGAADRLTVGLSAPTLEGLPPASEVAAAPSVAVSEPGLRLGATAVGDEELELLLEVIDLDSEVWTPVEAVPEEAGIVLAHKAAEDLGVQVGDRLVVEHPTRRGAASYAIVETTLPVVALHDVPLRPLAYLDRSHAGLLGLEEVVNQVTVVPQPGADADEVRAELFAVEGVTSVVSVDTTTETYEELVVVFRDFLVIVQGFLVVLLVLVAFNATSINVDERTREHATMLAMGVPLRVVVRTIVVENVLLGAAGALVGLVAGVGLLWWMARVALDRSVPDIDLVISLPLVTAVMSLGIAVVAVALTPVLLARRIARLNLPASLRVVE